jgi:monoamine oxidase
VVRALAEGVPIMYNTPAVEVHYGAQGVTVVTAAGLVVSAGACIVTVPLGVLKAGAISFTPPLPPAKAKAIGRLGCAVRLQAAGTCCT